MKTIKTITFQIAIFDTKKFHLWNFEVLKNHRSVILDILEIQK